MTSIHFKRIATKGDYNFDLIKFRSQLVFDYSKVPNKYHSSAQPLDIITVFKGSRLSLTRKPIISSGLQVAKHRELLIVRETLESGSDEAIFKIINDHTSAKPYSPFLSSTFSPEQAQLHSRPESHTIFEIHISANRCIIDPFDTGFTGMSKEIMILGAIFPDEIVAKKIINDNQNSELFGWNPSGTPIIKNLLEGGSCARAVKNPDNWERF